MNLNTSGAIYLVSHAMQFSIGVGQIQHDLYCNSQHTKLVAILPVLDCYCVSCRPLRNLKATNNNKYVQIVYRQRKDLLFA